MASEVSIANRALQKLGANRITSLTDSSTNARAANACYEILRDAELRRHTWNFAIKREALAADGTAPSWGRTNAFELPADFLRLLPPYPEDNFNNLDWQIEGRKIYTDDAAPLYVRYVAQVTDPNLMDALFRELLATRMAYEMCEELTQSNTKRDLLYRDIKDIVVEAKRTNAIENVSAETPTDTWITARL